jgi:hypothetical protein
MRDLQSVWAMWAKAVLFLIIGVTSASLILAQLPDWRILALLCLTIWSFCRAYYFAFYVIEHYLDPNFRYSGLFCMVRHFLSRKPPTGTEPKEAE